jgi:DHA1 family multidrug resistance protein-like MFS transporter
MVMDRKTIIFLLVSAAIFTDMMVYSLVIPVLPSYAMSLGADELTIGVIFGVFSVALLIFSIPLGLLSDRTGRRPIMVAGMLSLAAATIVFALSTDVYVLIAARVIQGISGAATWSAGLALLADTYGPEERGEKLGFALSIMSVGMLLGPVVGGLIYDNLGYVPTFVVPAVIACAIGLLFMLGRTPYPAIEKSKGASYLKPVLRAPAVFFTCVAIIVIGAGTFGIVEPYMPVYLYESYAATPTAIGIAFGFMALLGAITQPFAGRLYDRRGGRLIITAGLFASAAVIAAAMLMPTMVLTAGVFALIGCTISFVLSPMMPLLSDLYGSGAEGGSQGFAYGVYNTLFSLGLALGPFAGGLAITSFSFPLTLYGQAALLCVTGLLCYLFIPAVRKKGTAAPGAGT